MTSLSVGGYQPPSPSDLRAAADAFDRHAKFLTSRGLPGGNYAVIEGILRRWAENPDVVPNVDFGAIGFAIGEIALDTSEMGHVGTQRAMANLAAVTDYLSSNEGRALRVSPTFSPINRSNVDEHLRGIAAKLRAQKGAGGLVIDQAAVGAYLRRKNGMFRPVGQHVRRVRRKR